MGSSILLIQGVFFLWGLVLTPLSIMLAGRFGLIDLPNDRKIHNDPVPRGAGITLWTGFLFWALVFGPGDQAVRLAATGATVVFFAGYLDDMLSLSPFSRLLVQFGSAILVLSVIKEISVLRYLMYLFWIAGMTNAYNFIDGMNGLALIITFLACIALAFLGTGLWAVALAGLVLGVLPWNFPHARTFVGDGGVYLLGYLVSVLVVFFVEPMGYPFHYELLLLLFLGGLPLLDTLTAIFRRIVKGQSPFYPDRQHFHHRLLSIGLSEWAVLFILGSVQVLGALLAWTLLTYLKT